MTVCAKTKGICDQFFPLPVKGSWFTLTCVCLSSKIRTKMKIHECIENHIYHIQ